jgi:RluA family pseudouridine synthase
VSLATKRAEPHAAVARLLAALPEAERLPYGLAPEDLLLVHRLDVGTSGLVVLARDSEAHRDLVRAFAEHHVARLYLALVWGCPRPHQGTWEWPLGPDRSDRRRMRVEAAGRRAVTGFELIARAPHVSLLRLEPATGRTHQLRVHLAHAGHPIVGDDLYGGPRHRGPATPSTPELVLTAPPPADFATALDTLGIPHPSVEARPTRGRDRS